MIYPSPIECERQIDSAGVPLAGTLCLPAAQGEFPVVLLVHGSGPLDRNESAGGATRNAFNCIAEHLAGRGIASLRYDKRGCGHSGGNFLKAGHTDLVSDAYHWLLALADEPQCRIDQRFVLGHSEGSVIAPQLHQRCPGLAGLILLCPFVEPLETVMLAQAARLEWELTQPGRPLASLRRLWLWLLGVNIAYQRNLIDRLKRSTGDTLRIRGQQVQARWYREALALDPAELFRSISCPALVLGGAKDLQCDPADIETIAALIKGPVTAEVVPDLTHVLRFDPDPPLLSRTRRLQRRPVEPVVCEAVSLWVEEQIAPARSA